MNNKQIFGLCLMILSSSLMLYLGWNDIVLSRIYIIGLSLGLIWISLGDALVSGEEQ